MGKIKRNKFKIRGKKWKKGEKYIVKNEEKYICKWNFLKKKKEEIVKWNNMHNKQKYEIV